MAWLRYPLYFFGVALVTWLLTRLEIWSPGSLRLHILNEGDIYGTSEYSPIELIQPLILAVCGLLMLWVARIYPPQRPLAYVFGGLAIMFFVRELDYFLDRFLADNLWQALIVIVGSLLIVFAVRNRRRLRIALIRIWPSPGLALIFSGAVVLFAFVRLVGHEALWQAILGDDYIRVIKLAVEEFIELVGYLLCLIGSIEYAYQVHVMATAEPKPVARRKRNQRRPKM
jgi:multisubunit Na+/H+ antiporter MnhB subunit